MALVALQIMLGGGVALRAQGTGEDGRGGTDRGASPVFRGYRPPKLQRPSPERALWKQLGIFFLEREAAAGDPFAQHELGIRCLTGAGVAADTMRAVYWIRKAAEQDLIPAHYNYGLMQYHGWGGPWDPYGAFRSFVRAAELGMPEAQYVVGIFYTENLVVGRDWKVAWSWIHNAALEGVEAAKKTQDEMVRRGLISPQDTVTAHASAEGGGAPAPVASAGAQKNDDDFVGRPDWTPILLEVGKDTARASIPDARLTDNLLESIECTRADSLALRTLLDTTGAVDTAGLARVHELAREGNPEATIVLGRMLEHGRAMRRSSLGAAAHYVAAVWQESPVAAALLVDLLRAHSRMPAEIEEQAWAGNPEAQYVWAGMHALEIDNRLNAAMAQDLLRRAAAQRMQAAEVQLGLGLLTGRWTRRDPDAAAALWSASASQGNREAEIRLAAAGILGAVAVRDTAAALALLDSASIRGSMIASLALAHAWEQGIGRPRDPGKAVDLYRQCASRGSQNAYLSLRRMHDAQRPVDPLFTIREQP